MTDAILVKSGAVDGVIRNTDDIDAFGPKPDGAVYIVQSNPPVCGGQLWDGERATDPPHEPVVVAPKRKSDAELVFDQLAKIGVIDAAQAEAAKADVLVAKP